MGWIRRKQLAAKLTGLPLISTVTQAICTAALIFYYPFQLWNQDKRLLSLYDTKEVRSRL